MKHEIKYTDAPPDVERALDRALSGNVEFVDFLPPPEQLVRRQDRRKITIMLDSHIIDFFKRAAKEHGVKYQTMINNLLDSYVHHVESHTHRD